MDENPRHTDTTVDSKPKSGVECKIQICQEAACCHCLVKGVDMVGAAVERP